MKLIYTIAIRIYGAIIGVVALFAPKAHKRHIGGRSALAYLAKKIDHNADYIWFHAASLGEFEQGRPLLEKIKTQFPDKKILLTFFSPSGFEIRKNYTVADAICYLPLDTPTNVRAFMKIVRPKMAFFIKYEYWVNYLGALKEAQVPTYIISAIFRPQQVFFKWYGGFFRNALKAFTKLFVQNENSKELLASIGFSNVHVAGDTRFDRVNDIKLAAKVLPIVEAFAVNSDVVVAGSTWAPDEAYLTRYVNANKEKKMIIVPHETSPQRIDEICQLLRRTFVLYSQTTPEEAAKADCLVVDTVGLLSSIYQYGKVSYIGGGFGVGIHNTLEAAVWNKPVVFGPNYERFKEACDLIECGGAVSIATYRQLETRINELIVNTGAGHQAGDYVQSQLGAVNKIFTAIFNAKS